MDRENELKVQVAREALMVLLQARADAVLVDDLEKSDLEVNGLVAAAWDIGDEFADEAPRGIREAISDEMLADAGA